MKDPDLSQRGWVSATALAALVAISLACLDCLGEAAVSYQGTVTEGTSSGYSFDHLPNPTAAAPISGAKVEVCIDRCSGGRSVTSGTDGAFPEISASFGGFGRDTQIVVRATAPDGRFISYQTTYEDTSDPTVANPSCSPACPPVYLNLRIGR